VAYPRLVIEVLSPATQARDTQERRITHQRLVSLLEYVLVTQERAQNPYLTRRPKKWDLETCTERLRLAAFI
jgi:Uma2 family endonuclease